MTARDLFGREGNVPAGASRPAPATFAATLLDAAADQIAYVTGRSRSQVRAEIAGGHSDPTPLDELLGGAEWSALPTSDDIRAIAAGLSDVARDLRNERALLAEHGRKALAIRLDALKALPRDPALSCTCGAPHTQEARLHTCEGHR